MDAFTLHADVVEKYKNYLKSFTTISDQRIKHTVEKAFEQGDFIPEPLIQFNPDFAKGKSLQELVTDEKVHRDLPAIFGSYQLYQHQYEALELGVEGKGFIVTSGTGSGKSLTYLATIFDHILKLQPKERGVKAILVYPMNALINSQEDEIRKYHLNYLLDTIKPENPEYYKDLLLKEAIEELETRYHVTFPISYGKYTGQEGRSAREWAQAEQPDIILTNYMMLELIMTRQTEQWLRKSIRQYLQFLVFDELHTYRGRQGSDVSFLIRRIKHTACKQLICIGTSATMITEGTAEDRKRVVADIAGKIFSDTFAADQIIEETLTHSTDFDGTLPSPERVISGMERSGIPESQTERIGNFVPHSRHNTSPVASGMERSGIPESQTERIGNFVPHSRHNTSPVASGMERSGIPEAGSSPVSGIRPSFPIQPDEEIEAFRSHPLAIWLENAVALNRTDGQVVRGTPMALSTIAEQLQAYTQLEEQECHIQLRALLQWAENLNKHRQNCLPFKLHQFISQTNTVYVTLEDKANRTITIETGRFLKDQQAQTDRFIYPVLFSRHSGHEYLCVELDFDQSLITPRDPEDVPEQLTQKELQGKRLHESDFSSGYLVMQDEDSEALWNDDMLENLPESWQRPAYRYQLPRKIYFDTAGNFAFSPDYSMWGWYVPAKLRVDITAGIIYEDVKTKENTKLMRLGNEGRSTATTIMAQSIITALHAQGEDTKHQKLLSFTDNRQDASLQAGHFNDFISAIRLRSALHHALQDHPEGLDVDNITERLVEQLQLKESDYAKYPNDEWPDEDNERALKDYLLIRLLYDLKRGWRYVLPNLEQCGLLRIEYKKLADFVHQERFFESIPLLAEADHAERFEMLTQVLDYFRTSYAISHYKIEKQRAETENALKSKLDDEKLWSLEQDEWIEIPRFLRYKSPGKKTPKGVFTDSIGPRSNLGKYFKRLFAGKQQDCPKGDAYEVFMESLCELLLKGNFLHTEKICGDKEEVDGYRLRVDKIVWKPGDRQTVPPDKVRTSSYKAVELKPNAFFQALYTFDFSSFRKPIVGREHTGQLSAKDRIEREKEFRAGDVSSLFCSPTMELGIDIADLNVVHMRNVPPSPANYAQRSGRAGRSGQAAVVFTYCSSWSPHDRNYFKQKDKMISGAVVPPRIDLTNEELIRSHLNAYILMELALGEEALKSSIDDVLDLNRPDTLPLKADIVGFIEDRQQHRQAAWVSNFTEIIHDVVEALHDTYWFNEQWLRTQTAKFLQRFDAAFHRWRLLYRNALSMKARAQAVIDDHTIKRSSPEEKEARRQRDVAEKQLALLRNEQNRAYGNESEFYVFRYLASEGFLPGYNFTRLPVRAYMGYRHQEEGEYISRPRFLALREFGPMNLIYHKGNKFRMNRMMLLDAETSIRSIKISKHTGYAFLDDDARIANNDPITHEELIGQDSIDTFNNVLEIGESEGIPQERISCEEEERMSRGFEIEQCFRYPHGIDSTRQSVIKVGNQPLLRLIYGPATELIQVNKKWKRSQDSGGFHIDNRNGRWLRQRDLEREDIAEHVGQIRLFARDTADSLYIQPMQDLEVDADQIISLSYALKRGIERLFQVEESEISVLVLGDQEGPNILIYEAAEGSLGILSQLVQQPAQMKRLFEEAYRVIHFDPVSHEDLRPDLPKATYDDLLSYYNQSYHDRLDRTRIQEPLKRLMDYDIEPMHEHRDREQHFRYLLECYDPNSATEKPFLEFLYYQGYALPDKAQVNIAEFYINADFVYNLSSGPVLVFCDGSIHDTPVVQEDDSHKRDLLRDTGYDVIEWHHSESLESLVTRRRDVFRKVC